MPESGLMSLSNWCFVAISRYQSVSALSAAVEWNDVAVASAAVVHAGI